MPLAVHSNELDKDGTAKDLLVPPAGCRTLNSNNVSPPIGALNTDRISLNISSSSIAEPNLIFPIRPFFAKYSRMTGLLGIAILPLLA